MTATDERAVGETAPGWRRVAAFGIDYLVIAAYAGLLAAVGLLARALGVVPGPVTTPAGRVVGQLLAFLALNVPVTLWFVVWEASRWGATPGKRLLRLRVVTTDGRPVGVSRSLLRTVLKFTLPWELAHTAIWNLTAWPGDPDGPLATALLVAANAIIVVYLVSLFVGARRPPYDRVTGTRGRSQPGVTACGLSSPSCVVTARQARFAASGDSVRTRRPALPVSVSARPWVPGRGLTAGEVQPCSSPPLAMPWNSNRPRGNRGLSLGFQGLWARQGLNL